MIKRIVVGALVFCIGITTALLLETELRLFVRTLYSSLTGNAIYFYGKDFHLFEPEHYYLSFGFSFLGVWMSIQGRSLKEKLMGCGWTLLIFGVTLIGLCWLGAIRKLAECTACDDGTRAIHYNDINYSGLTTISWVIALIPVGIRLKRKVKGPSKTV